MKRLILLPSTEMDKQKQKTNEEVLLRMTGSGRASVGKSEIELTAGGIERVFKVTRAYREDIRDLENKIASGQIDVSDKSRVAWVTSKTARILSGKAALFEAWIPEEGIINVKLGCDPEFILAKDGKSINARSVMIRLNIDGYGKLGCDTHGYQAELRPDPSTNVSELVNNMRKILKGAEAKKIQDYLWFAGSYFDRTIGGHIHIDNPKQVSKNDTLRRAFIHVTARILDEMVGVPLSRIEGEGGKIRRTTGMPRSYGWHLDYRTEAGRLEWRVPGGDWVAHPAIADSTLTTSKAVIEEIVLKIKELDGKIVDKLTPRNEHAGWEENWDRHPIIKTFGLSLSSEKLNDILKGGPNKTDLKKILRQIQSFSTYEKYKEGVDFFSELCSSSATSLKNMERDMRKTWLEGAKIFK